MTWKPQRIAVAGLGLLGASLAEAARRRWPDAKVTGISSPKTLAKATAAGLIQRGMGYADIDLAVADADIVILCTPIDPILKTLEAWEARPPACKPDCIFTDVGSTKADICALGAKAFPASGPGVFVGSHPMAGSEKTGLEARDPLLFQNASWVICAGEGPRAAAAADRLQDFAQSLGARVTRMPADLHDEVAAHVSHLPQMLSTALASYVGGRRSVVENCLQIAGGGFRDMTRLAASSFHVWEPILRSNQAAVKAVVSGFRTHLAGVEAALDGDLGAGYFTEGNRLRAQLSTAKKGFAVPLSEILVDVEDKPGELVRVFAPLSAAALNVLDVEILKVREGEGGVLMLGFHGNEEAAKAIVELAAAGFRARAR